MIYVICVVHVDSGYGMDMCWYRPAIAKAMVCGRGRARLYVANHPYSQYYYRNRGSNLTPSCSYRLWNQGTWNQVSDLLAAGVGQGTVLIATG